MLFSIGISGVIGSGKSHLAQELHTSIALLGYDCVLYPMAKDLKQFTSKLCDDPVINYDTAFNFFAAMEQYTIIQIDEAAKATAKAWEEFGKGVVGKPRRFLQFLGTDIGRKMLSDDIWVKLRDHKTAHAQVRIADDIRFDNELSEPGTHIHIQTNQTQRELILNRNKEKFGADYVFNTHVSENALTHIPDYTIPWFYNRVDYVRLVSVLVVQLRNFYAFREGA